MTINWSNIIRQGMNVPKVALRDGLQQITNLIYGLINGTISLSSLVVSSSSPKVSLIRGDYSNSIETDSSVSGDNHYSILDIDTVVPFSQNTTQNSSVRFWEGTQINGISSIEIWSAKQQPGDKGICHVFKSDGSVSLASFGPNRKVGINTYNPRLSFDINTTDAIVIPSGTTSQRPSNPPIGARRFNTDLGTDEIYTSNGWQQVPLGSSVVGISPLPERRVQYYYEPNNELLSPSFSAERLELDSTGKIVEVNVIIEVAGSSGSLLLPSLSDGAYVGLSFLIKNSCTGNLTINAPANHSINGQSSINCPWMGGYVLVTAVNLGPNNSLFWEAYGDTEQGIALPKTVVKGDLILDGFVIGGRNVVGSPISSNYTVSNSDAGTIRHVITANILITVSSSFRGVAKFVFDESAKIKFEGSSTEVSISQGKYVIVDVHQYGSYVYKSIHESSPLRYEVSS